MLATLRSMWDLSSHDQGSNSCFLQWKRSLNHWTAKEVPTYTYIKPLVEQLDATTSATHAHTHIPTVSSYP